MGTETQARWFKGMSTGTRTWTGNTQRPGLDGQSGWFRYPVFDVWLLGEGMGQGLLGASSGCLGSEGSVLTRCPGGAEVECRGEAEVAYRDGVQG